MNLAGLGWECAEGHDMISIPTKRLLSMPKAAAATDCTILEHQSVWYEMREGGKLFISEYLD